jgi:DNA repair exonuclease SbcCD nuclease subunit
MDVDAIIHAGDVFDHNTSQSDLDTVHKEVTRTCEQEIPFYFIRGNHDETSGRQLLNRLTAEQSKCCRLTTEETFIHGEGTSAITYGYDNSGGQLPPLSPDHYLRTLPMPDLLVIHDTPYPVVDEEGEQIYNPEHLDLQDFLAESTLTPDLIISGHMHMGGEGTVRNCDVPVLTTGPTAPINSSTEDNEPSTWLLSVSGTTPVINRQPL